MPNHKIIQLKTAYSKKPNNFVDNVIPKHDNKDGGEPPMDKYVTHSELKANNEEILHQMDNHFAELRTDLNKEFRNIDRRFTDIEQKTDKRFNDLEKKTDKRFNNLEEKTDTRFNENDKKFNQIRLDLNDVKNTANSNKEKINWLLYTVVGGIGISIITTIVSNLLTR